MRLTSLALLAPVSHGWISISQSKYGATIEHIHTESLGQDAGDPRRSLGYLWTLPDDAEDNTGLRAQQGIQAVLGILKALGI